MNWKEKLKDNVSDVKELRKYLPMSSQEADRIGRILEKYPMSITPYYLSLVNKEDEGDPIRRMCIPSLQEESVQGSFDTSGEADNTVIVGMQHKYRQTALILSTSCCSMYCRHCFRKRFVGTSDDEIAKHLHEMEDYIRGHKEITNVLISGGDSFMLSNEKIQRYLEIFSGMQQLDFIRFGTRTPVVFPQRITEDPQLLEILKKYGKKKQIYVVTQFNHTREFTDEAKAAVHSLQKCGVVLRNQTVLLRGVNDTPKEMGALFKKLTSWGIAPYYVFQCRPVVGVKSQFQVPIDEGHRIVKEARSMQNGMGKHLRYCLSHPSGKIEIVGKLPDGKMIFKYHEAKHEKDQGRIFTQKLSAHQCWLEHNQ